MKTIGTLEEIGAQVGDVVDHKLPCGNWQKYYVCFGEYPIASIDGNNKRLWLCGSQDGNIYVAGWSSSVEDCRIISRAAKSPVRTVTRKEIVPGIYGKVSVADTAGQWIEIEFVGEYGHTGRPRLTASDLTAAIKTLTEIRDAMENH